MMRPLAQVTPVDLLGPDHAALGTVFGVASQSTGSTLLDASIGALAGYAIAPTKDRWRYVAIAAVATGLAGICGLVGSLAYGYSQRQR